MTPRVRRRSWLVCFLVAWLVEAVLTHTPADRLPDVPTSDKTEHFLAYGVLAGLLVLVLRARRVRFVRRLWMVPVVLLGWAVIDEVTQPLFNRYCSGWDILADAGGIAIALLIDATVQWRQKTEPEGVSC